MPLIHGQEIGAGEAERDLCSWDGTRLARLCESVALAMTWRDT